MQAPIAILAARSHSEFQMLICRRRRPTIIPRFRQMAANMFSRSDPGQCPSRLGQMPCVLQFART